MSFSISYVGTPTALKRKLIGYSSELSGTSKREFDEVLPSLCNILDQNISPTKMALSIEVHGHATFDQKTNEKVYGSCGVTIRNIGVFAEDTPEPAV